MENIAETIVKETEKRRAASGSLIIAIDGRCAAGKTTLAAYLQMQLDCNVFHMDDFFLQPRQRTEKRLSEPGGNVNYERFLEEVLNPLSKGLDVTYRPYSCQSGQYLETVIAESGRVNLVEGAYSCHPALWDFYDLRIFLTVDKHEQMQRIYMRNGLEQGKIFESKWIPLEELYFSKLHIEERSDFCFKSNTRKERTTE